MNKLIKNAIRCKKCGDIIESKYRHDFEQCSCGAVFVDGGLDYRRIGGNKDDWEDLSEYRDVPGYYITHWTHYGGKYNFTTTEDINSVISLYEDTWGYVIVEDENRNEIYRSEGLNDFLKRHNYA